MAIILGVDPGSEKSAVVFWNTKAQKVEASWTAENGKLRKQLIEARDVGNAEICIIEGVAFYGKILNSATFQTLMFIGRLQEIFHESHEIVYFPDIAYHFCNARRGVKTSNINAVLRDRFKGKGTQKNPGILWGIKGHEWSALAVAIFWMDIQVPHELIR